MEIGKTMSVCPVCLAKIPAKKVVGDDGNIYMEKRCWDHGNFRTLIWEGDIESYIAWAEGDANGIVMPVRVQPEVPCVLRFRRRSEASRSFFGGNRQAV